MMPFFFNLHWLSIIAIIIALLIFLALFGRKSVHAEIFIPATQEKVWSVLMDTSQYKEWNPILIPLNKKFIEGEKIQYEMTDNKGNLSTVSAKIVKIIDNEIINQFGGFPGIMTFNHTWTLEEAESGTRVVQHEEYRGIGVLFWNPEWVEKAYEAANENLKERVTKKRNL